MIYRLRERENSTGRKLHEKNKKRGEKHEKKKDNRNIAVYSYVCYRADWCFGIGMWCRIW